MISTLDEQAAYVAGLLRNDDGVVAEPPCRFGTAIAWLVRRGPERLVLKRGRPEQGEADVAWEHDHLRSLAAAGFPSSWPVPAFGGQSWVRVEGRIWAALSYLEGQPLVSQPAPEMAAAGAFLARYHRVVRRIPAPEQRPTAAGLGQLRAVTPMDRLSAILGDSDSFRRYLALLDDLEAGLGSLEYDRLEHLVIHGDATNDNLIVDASPSRIVGMIDFGGAHVAPWPADLAAALWRSGRPDPEVIEYDSDRVWQYVAGYHREAPLLPELARAIPLLMQGRGLQLLSRRARRLPPDQPIAPSPYAQVTLHRAEWLHAHRAELVDLVAGVLAEEPSDYHGNG